MKCRLLGLIVVVCVTSFVADAEAQLFRRWRASRACGGSACGSAVQKEATQKTDETPVQKTAEQKDETPVQTEKAVQKDEDATQKSVNAVVVTQGSSLYNLCLRKARWQAARGRVGHPGWGMGGLHYEGAGSGSTPQAALNGCCFAGQRKVAAQAVVKSANGRYYATRIYY